jgi:2-oxoglutarate dehydrogenase E2 component (dihydrolipoamide succinyltransferase)
VPLLDVKIPTLGESLTSGVLARWRVHDGDFVNKDQPLYELETDKITAEGTAEAAGRITLKAAAGDTVQIGAVVAVIDTGQRKPASAEASAGRPDTGKAPSPPSGDTIRSPVSGIPDSPAVRRLAAETGVNPATVAGTGKGGRVTKGDMLAAADTGERKPASAEASVGRPETGKKESVAAAPPSAPPETIRSPVSEIQDLTTAPFAPVVAPRQTRRKMTPLRQRLAQRLVQAQREAAMLTTFNEVDLSAVRDLRTKYQEEFTKKYGVKLGYMSFFVKAVVRALQEVPAVNALLDGDTVVENHYYDIGVAVSTDRGLLVPVLHACDRASFAGIEQQLAAAAQKAREGKIALADLEGGVFTITNGGVFGSLLSTPILNAPQCAILGMHAIQERPVAVAGQVVIRPMMYLALSYDHRIVDGREAVTFLVRVKQALEDPARLILGV